jgi:hypothetical protein
MNSNSSEMCNRTVNQNVNQIFVRFLVTPSENIDQRASYCVFWIF